VPPPPFSVDISLSSYFLKDRSLPAQSSPRRSQIIRTDPPHSPLRGLFSPSPFSMSLSFLQKPRRRPLPKICVDDLDFSFNPASSACLNQTSPSFSSPRFTPLLILRPPGVDRSRGCSSLLRLLQISFSVFSPIFLAWVSWFPENISYFPPSFGESRSPFPPFPPNNCIISVHRRSYPIRLFLFLVRNPPLLRSTKFCPLGPRMVFLFCRPARPC